MTSVLDLFSLPVARWFAATYAAPTPPQERGWPEIARGRNTLILAPTGSGKTLAAFLYAVNELATRPPAGGAPRGVHTVYVSPLRALATDIERNLEVPLAGIQACAATMGVPVSLPRVAVRTGDTPPAERQRMLRRPPELLITTPESLHLLLTARRSREMLRTVRYVIVDEIHTLCGEKRGSFLALLLERLSMAAGQDPIRIGLSATQRPLERVAQYLGGYDAAGAPRPVTIVDCGIRKHLDLQVVAPRPDLRAPAADDGPPSVWPAIYDRLLELARAHRSTLIFANNRRAVERIAAEMNRRAGHRLVRAHHGSVSKEARREMEGDLKAGRVPALVATASLELGIDMGAIDLVCQVETPTSVASALQRVGRAGHALGARSAGRMIPKTRNDLVRMAAMARAMLRGEISHVHVPENPLDVLAQQVVAMVAAEDWQADALYARVRQADPFHRLPRASFDAVLAMVAGEFHTPAFPALRARILWEKGAGRLSALPGALPAAIAAGGTIPDTGQYAMVLDDGATRLGELDEEFVFERRIGDTFVLGTGRWRIVDIRADRVVVAASAADEAQLPFWKGDGLGHDVEFGQQLGAFLAECTARRATGDLVPWLQGECASRATCGLRSYRRLGARFTLPCGSPCAPSCGEREPNRPRGWSRTTACCCVPARSASRRSSRRSSHCRTATCGRAFSRSCGTPRTSRCASVATLAARCLSPARGPGGAFRCGCSACSRTISCATRASTRDSRSWPRRSARSSKTRSPSSRSRRSWPRWPRAMRGSSCAAREGRLRSRRGSCSTSLASTSTRPIALWRRRRPSTMTCSAACFAARGRPTSWWATKRSG